MSVSVLSAFSTCRAQSAHVMPVTERVCSFMMFLANRRVPLRFRAERHTVESIERSYQHRSHGMARSEEHTSELQSLMRISYAVFCLQKKNHIANANTVSPRHAKIANAVEQ